MEFFLERIARSIHDQYGNTLNRHCLVFPGRRPGLYFQRYLAALIDKPVWSPSIMTINELFSSHSDLQLAGNEILLFELYKVYSKHKVLPESFDDFYYWGDMLLNDFDDVDKYIVDASSLFSNIRDLKLIDQKFGGLNDDQVAVIKRFWVNFNPEKVTSEKEGFLSIWNILNVIYTEFRSSLRSQNLAYEGMIFRDIIEQQKDEVIHSENYDIIHFIGFNALNRCEKELMLSLRKAQMAKFYWDYDNSFLKTGRVNSAGYFLKENLNLFGNDMPSDWSYDSLIDPVNTKAVRKVIDASSDVAQVKLISFLLDEIPGLNPENAHQTAVVLADEKLLLPVLTSLPADIGDINITMGLPLRQTLVYSAIRGAMDLQRNSRSTDNSLYFHSKQVIALLKHSMIAGFQDSSADLARMTNENIQWVPGSWFTGSPALEMIFKKPESPQSLSQYFKDFLSLLASADENEIEVTDKNLVKKGITNEFIYRIILSLNRLDKVLKSSDIKFNNETYLKILDRMLRVQSVPFSGEPLSGIQIMGILETRVLDFKNLVILSVNEGILPAISSGSSFIPYALRETFGLPSLNHQESVYAYHFYRLLQRAENVSFVYNSNSEGLRSGEISRFLTQMRYEYVKVPQYRDLNLEIRSQTVIRESLNRNEEHKELLYKQYLDGKSSLTFSPSALNTWLGCSMKFYYRYVCRLKEPESISGEIDPAMLGRILHEIMRAVYSVKWEKPITKQEIELLIENRQYLSGLVSLCIHEIFRSGSDSEVTGNELIIRDVLLAYITKILKADSSFAPISIKALESSFAFTLPFSCNGRNNEIRIGGIVDRVDAVMGKIRIVDYKTGSVTETISSIEDLFADDRKKELDGWLQTLVYCEAYLPLAGEVPVMPSVYAIRRLAGGRVSDRLRIKNESKSIFEVDDYNTVRENFLSALTETITTIFSENQPFKMTSDIRGKCSYCPYKTLCMR